MAMDITPTLSQQGSSSSSTSTPAFDIDDVTPPKVPHGWGGVVGFEAPDYYTGLAYLGDGSFGDVCSATDTRDGRRVAIKKIVRPFSKGATEHVGYAQRAFREVSILQAFERDGAFENVISGHDFWYRREHEGSDFVEVYFACDGMDTDLHRALHEQDWPFTEWHCRYICYQVLRGFKYHHSAGIIHRDIKPKNIGVMETCDVKILDFGLGRKSTTIMTGLVCTPPYRAPEVMTSWQKYDSKVDIWSLGCCFAEMLTKNQLFYTDANPQTLMRSMIDTLGTPPEELQSLWTPPIRSFVSGLDFVEAGSFRDKPEFAHCSDGACDLLDRLLAWDPDQRPSAEEIIGHPYFQELEGNLALHAVDDEPDFTGDYNDDYESLEDINEALDWQEMTIKIIDEFNAKSG